MDSYRQTVKTRVAPVACNRCGAAVGGFGKRPLFVANKFGSKVMLGPEHDVNGQTVCTAAWMFYRDLLIAWRFRNLVLDSIVTCRYMLSLDSRIF